MLRQALARALSLVAACAAVACASDAGSEKSKSASAVDARAQSARFDDAWRRLDGQGLVSCRGDDPATPTRVADAMRRMGLAPAFEDDRYERDLAIPQPFATARVTLAGRQVGIGTGSVALPSSAHGDATGPLVFAGYGIVAPDRQRDDYAGVDAKGAVVVLFSGRPDDVARSGAFQDPPLARHGHDLHKVKVAAERGAVGVLFVAPPGGYEAEAGVLPEPMPATAFRAPLPAAYVQTKLVQTALSPAGASLAQLKKLLARDGAAPLATKVEARVEVAPATRDVVGWAVVGVAAGAAGEANNVVVQGACGADPRWASFRGAPRPTAAAAVFLGERVARQPLERTVVVVVTSAGGATGRAAYRSLETATVRQAGAVLDVAGVREREGPLFAASSVDASAARGPWSRSVALLPSGGAAPGAFGQVGVVNVRTAEGAPDSDDIGPALTQLMLDIEAAGGLPGSGQGDAAPLGMRLLPAPPPFSGALVDGVLRDSPADVGGVRPGDLIVKVGDSDTPALGATLSALASASGDVRVRISRRGDAWDLVLPAPSVADR